MLFMKDGGKYAIGDAVYPISAGSVRFHKPGDIVYSHRYSDIYVVHFDVGRPGTRVRELEAAPAKPQMSSTAPIPSTWASRPSAHPNKTCPGKVYRFLSLPVKDYPLLLTDASHPSLNLQ
ncbi:MAG: hypothetical protein IJ493_05955 [Clostridia bacterium]|nr:hypothetical protein [Clostridia bacterium]